MLNDASGFEKVYIACGYSDMRRGIDGFASMIQQEFKLDPFQPGTLFLFCGRKTDRIKGILLGRRWVLALIQAFGDREISMAA